MAKGKHPWLWPATMTGAMVPLAWILLRAGLGMLGADPVATALNQLGLLALIFLLLSLACTPLKIIFSWTWPIALRKSLGNLGFFYACCHFMTYAAIDQGFAFGPIVADITQRKFIFVGFAALVLLTPLAITSTSRMLKRLGFKRWKRLHRLAYLAAGLGVVHFILRVKKDVSEPAIYAAILGLLFAIRIVAWMRERDQRAAAVLTSIKRS